MYLLKLLNWSLTKWNIYRLVTNPSLRHTDSLACSSSLGATTILTSSNTWNIWSVYLNIALYIKFPRLYFINWLYYWNTVTTKLRGNLAPKRFKYLKKPECFAQKYRGIHWTERKFKTFVLSKKYDSLKYLLTMWNPL